MLAVMKKELKSYFFSPIGYVVIGIFLLCFRFLKGNLHEVNESIRMCCFAVNKKCSLISKMKITVSPVYHKNNLGIYFI